MVDINRDVEAVRRGEPIMTLRAPSGPQPAEFIRFEKANKWLGSIKEDGRGLTLSSAGGDIAEWHRVADKPGKKTEREADTPGKENRVSICSRGG